MDRPSQNHRDPWFPPFFQQILEDTKYIFKTTEGTPFIFPGTGTGGWEVGLTNTLSPGDKIVTFRYGQFSHLWIDMMKRLDLDVRSSILMDFPPCLPILAVMANLQQIGHGLLASFMCSSVAWVSGMCYIASANDRVMLGSRLQVRAVTVLLSCRWKWLRWSGVVVLMRPSWSRS